jgi:hypothetical protein
MRVRIPSFRSIPLPLVNSSGVDGAHRSRSAPHRGKGFSRSRFQIVRSCHPMAEDARLPSVHAGSNPADCTTSSRPGGQIGKVTCSRSRSFAGSNPAQDTRILWRRSKLRPGNAVTKSTSNIPILEILERDRNIDSALIEEWQTRLA